MSILRRLFALSSFFFLSLSIAHAQSEDPEFAKQMHMEVVNSQLNMLENDDTNLAKTPEEVIKNPFSSMNNLEDQDNPRESKNNRHFELAFQTDSMHYQTGSKWPYYYSLDHSTSDKIKKDDTLNGVFASVRWNGPLHSWKEFNKGDEVPNFGKLEIEYSRGNSEYSSYVAGKDSYRNAWKLDARFLFGYDYALTQATDLTAYVGVGYLTYSDKDGDWIDWGINSYQPYTTITNYFYIPVGFETHTDFNDQWALNFKFEFDFLAAGYNNYHMNDISGTYYLTDISDNQVVQFTSRPASSPLQGGLGFRTSLKLIRKYKYCDFYAQPYLNFMYLAQSRHIQYNALGINGKNYVSLYPNGSDYNLLWNAKSTTVDLGARLGVDF